MIKITKTKKPIIFALLIVAVAILSSSNWIVQIFSRIISAFSTILIAVAVAFFIRPLIKVIQKLLGQEKSGKLLWPTLIAYTIVIVSIVLFFKWLSGPIYRDGYELWENITSKQFVTLLSERIDKLFSTNSFQLLNTIASEIRKWWNLNLKDYLLKSAGKTTLFLTKTIFQILFITAVSIYISIDYPSLKKGIISLSNRSAYKTNKTLEEITIGMKAWAQGWIKDQAFIFICTLAALWALGISSYLTLATIMTLFNFIPFVGPIVGGLLIWVYIIAVHVGIPGTYVFNTIFINSEITIIASFIAIVAIQTIESLWWVPKVYSEQISVKPLTILVSLSLISTIFSPFLSPLTIPIIVIIKIISKNYLPKK